MNLPNSHIAHTQTLQSIASVEWIAGIHGVSSWIIVRQAHHNADASGTANQHLQYIAFGESFINQRATSHDIRYKFTGKERDNETGFDYFGARYYSSGMSIWLSVDPLASNAPNWSPYNYVWGNPVKNIDEWGLWGKLKANWNQWVATKKYGKDRVGEVYYNSKKEEYGFRVYSVGQDKYNKKSKDGGIISYRGRGLYSNKDYKSFKWSRVSGHVGFKARMARSTNAINDFMAKNPTGLGSINTGESSVPHKICKIVADVNPLISVTSSGRIFLGDGKNIHGEEADGGDKVLAALDLLTLGGSETIKILPSSIANKGAKLMSESISEINGFVIDLAQSVKTGTSSPKKKEE